MSSSERSSTAIQPIINIQVTLNSDPLSTESTKINVPGVKKEDPLKVELDRITSMKSEATDTYDVRTNNIKERVHVTLGMQTIKIQKCSVLKG